MKSKILAGVAVVAVVLCVAGGLLAVTGIDFVDGVKIPEKFNAAHRYIVPTREAVADAATITADACGGIKLIHVNGTAAVTTDTTNTFTAPSSSYEGCVMHVVNNGSVQITLDENTNFVSAGNVALAAGDAATVVCDGTYWYQVGASNN